MKGQLTRHRFGNVIISNFRTRFNSQLFANRGVIGVSSVTVLRVTNVQQNNVQVDRALPTMSGVLHNGKKAIKPFYIFARVRDPSLGVIIFPFFHSTQEQLALRIASWWSFG